MQIFVCSGLLLTNCLSSISFAQEKPVVDEIKYYYNDEEISLSQAVQL